MRDPERIKRILNKIRDLWVHQPDTRLMQLLLNQMGDAPMLYYLEDDDLERRIDEAYTRYINRPDVW